MRITLEEVLVFVDEWRTRGKEIDIKDAIVSMSHFTLTHKHYNYDKKVFER